MMYWNVYTGSPFTSYSNSREDYQSILDMMRQAERDRPKGAVLMTYTHDGVEYTVYDREDR